jgi:AsmA protein
MNKPLKVLLYVIAATVALLVAVVAFIVATFNPNDYKPEIIQLVKAKTGRTLSIPGDIRLTLFPRVGADLGQLSLSEPRSEQTFAAALQVKVSVALMPLLRKEVQVDRVLIDGLSVKLQRDRQGRFNFDDLLAKGEAPAAQAETPPPAAALPRLNVGGITISKASLDYRDAASGQRLTVSNLNFSTGPIAEGQKSQLDLSADIQGAQPALALQLTLQSDFRPALAEQKIRFENLSLKLAGSAAGQRELQLKLGLAGVDASAQRIEATGLSLDVTAPNPAGGTVSLKAQGQASVDLMREAVQLGLDGTLDSTTLALKAGVQKFARPAITFDLALGELDADRYLSKARPSAAPAGAAPAASPPVAGAPGAGPQPVIDLGTLRGLDLNGALKVASLKIMNLKAASIRLQLKAQGGRAEIKPVTATLYGGGVNGSLYADAGGGQRLGARLDLRGIQIGPLMKDAMGQQPLEGRGNVALDLGTSGNTVRQFKQNLNGTAGVQLADGALNGIDIAGALRNFKAKLGGGSPQGQAAAQQKTDFTEFIASLKITNGVARNDDLSAKTPLLRLGGSGDIYLAQDRLDYTVKATVVPTLQGQGGPELEQLKGLTIPVRLSGPYSAIAWKIDFGSLASQRKSELTQETRQKLDAKKEEAREMLKDKAGDKLRNLLKR